jgi:hypothetical protein
MTMGVEHSDKKECGRTHDNTSKTHLTNILIEYYQPLNLLQNYMQPINPTIPKNGDTRHQMHSYSA